MRSEYAPPPFSLEAGIQSEEWLIRKADRLGISIEPSRGLSVRKGMEILDAFKRPAAREQGRIAVEWNKFWENE